MFVLVFQYSGECSEAAIYNNLDDVKAAILKYGEERFNLIKAKHPRKFRKGEEFRADDMDLAVIWAGASIFRCTVDGGPSEAIFWDDGEEEEADQAA